MRKFEHTLKTGGNGLWSNKVKQVKVEGLALAYENDEGNFGELRVYFDTKSWDVEKDGLIYTDSVFLRELWGALYDAGYSTDVSYSEQGMQGDDYVSLDVGGAFIRSWYENKSWDEECVQASRTPGTQQWAETYSDNLGESND